MAENLLHEIRDDLISSTPFSDTLRKTVVLASRLKVSALGDWARHELNGYKKPDDVPDYRIIPCATYVDYVVPARGQLHIVSNVPANYQIDEFRLMHVRDGIRSLEDMVLRGKDSPDIYIGLDFEPHLFETLAGLLAKNEGKQLQKAQRRAPISAAAQIIDSAKNRLLDFVLELDNLAEVSGERIQVDRTQATHLFQQIIMGTAQVSIRENNTMTVFDQRGQDVNYQYNAARDINFARVQNNFELIEELEKLEGELGRAISAGTMDEDTATDAEYEMKKAVQQVKKDAPDKKGVIGHLTKVKTLIGDIATLSGLVKGVAEAIEAVQKFLP